MSHISCPLDADCQRFAYAVLALFGLACPPLRSSDLWDDRTATAVVRNPEPLDLMLYNRTTDPFSAHVAVWMAPGVAVISTRAAAFHHRDRQLTTNYASSQPSHCD